MSAPTGYEISARAEQLRAQSVVVATDKGSELRQVRHNGFKVWYWTLNANVIAAQIRDESERTIFFNAQLDPINAMVRVSKCMRGEWREAFMAP